jgi:hypothetical protein
VSGCARRPRSRRVQRRGAHGRPGAAQRLPKSKCLGPDAARRPRAADGAGARGPVPVARGPTRARGGHRAVDARPSDGAAAAGSRRPNVAAGRRRRSALADRPGSGARPPDAPGAGDSRRTPSRGVPRSAGLQGAVGVAHAGRRRSYALGARGRRTWHAVARPEGRTRPACSMQSTQSTPPALHRSARGSCARQKPLRRWGPQAPPLQGSRPARRRPGCRASPRTGGRSSARAWRAPP